MAKNWIQRLWDYRSHCWGCGQPEAAHTPAESHACRMATAEAITRAAHAHRKTLRNCPCDACTIARAAVLHEEDAA